MIKLPETAQELEAFSPQSIVINHTTYIILTGFENTDHKCFWCGEELKGKLKRYCRGHMTEYYHHFAWTYASFLALKKADRKCMNCGSNHQPEVHHIVPLKGSRRDFSVYNLSWNLMVLCHKCHVAIHVVMRIKPDVQIGKLSQSVMSLETPQAEPDPEQAEFIYDDGLPKNP